MQEERMRLLQNKHNVSNKREALDLAKQMGMGDDTIHQLQAELFALLNSPQTISSPTGIDLSPITLSPYTPSPVVHATPTTTEVEA